MKKFTWPCGEKTDILPQKCQFCRKQALVLLSRLALSVQPDKTNVDCHPLLGGCNHGFELEGFPTNSKKRRAS